MKSMKVFNEVDKVLVRKEADASSGITTIMFCEVVLRSNISSVTLKSVPFSELIKSSL